MPVWRLQTSWQFDTAFPRDRIIITPHFDDGGALTDPEGLCDDLLAALLTWYPTTAEVRVTAYDAQGTPPVFPQGEAIANVGAIDTSNVFREAALCLSYYSERNLPRRRGRLYVPGEMVSTNIGVRPTSAAQTKVGALADIFANLGGADVDWVVYSRLTDQAHPVTNWWVDNEWDVVRSRGLRSDQRLQGTTSEA